MKITFLFETGPCFSFHSIILSQLVNQVMSNSAIQGFLLLLLFGKIRLLLGRIVMRGPRHACDKRRVAGRTRIPGQEPPRQRRGLLDRAICSDLARRTSRLTYDNFGEVRSCFQGRCTLFQDVSMVQVQVLRRQLFRDHTFHL